MPSKKPISIFSTFSLLDLLWSTSTVGLQQYTDASVNHDIFSNDTNIDI